MSNQTIVNGSEVSGNIFGQLNLTPRQIYEQVVMTQPAYDMGKAAIPKLMDIYGTSASIKSGSRTWDIPRMSNQFKKANVQSRTGEGTSYLQVTLTDPTYNAIAVNTLVQDPSSGTFAKVVNMANGQMTLEFDSNSGSSATVFGSSDFANGALISPRGVVGNNVTRQSTSGSYSIPDIESYPIGTWDYNCEMLLDDLKRQTYIVNLNGTNYYAKVKQMEVLNEMYTRFYAYNYSDAKAISSDLTPRSPSLINQIKTYAPNNVIGKSKPEMNLSEFEDVATEFIRNGSINSNHIIVLGGLDYMKNIFRILRGYVTTAGTNNVLGGAAVKGLDVKHYEILGVTFSFMLDPFLENQNIFGSTRSNSAMWIDSAKVQLQTGALAAPIYQVYNAIDGLHAWNVEGGIDINGNPIQSGSNNQLMVQTNYHMEGSWFLANPKAALYHKY